MPSAQKIEEDATRAGPVEADWIEAARAMLIEGGVAAVQISPLAARLKVTRGGFYWRFHNRQDLLDHLLADWQNSNTRSLVRAVSRAGTPHDRYRRLVRLWIEEKEFNPALDSAIRQWGTVDPAVRERVLEADQERIAAIAGIFRDLGQPELEAMIRARIVYFHQIGYYTLGLTETRSERQRLLPMYTQILAGFDA